MSDAVLRDIRCTRLARRRLARTETARPLVGFIRTLGGNVVSHFTGIQHLLRVSLPSVAVRALAAHPAVARVSPYRRVAVQDAPEPTYLCAGSPARADATLPDTGSCVPGGVGADFWEDARSAVLNAWPYIDRGYDGAGATVTGLATWAILDEKMPLGVFGAWSLPVPHLVVGVVDANLEPYHYGLATIYGEFRTRYVIQSGRLREPPDFFAFVAPNPTTDSHGQSSTGVALGSIAEGQDPRVTDPDAREARSGRARRALTVFSDDLLALLDELGDRIDGLDIITQSQSLNEGAGFDSNGDGINDLSCPENAEARGIDDTSEAITAIFYQESVVYVKSAGNMHSSPGVTACPTDEAYEVSNPGASPAALAIGALGDWFNPTTAVDAQVTDQLYGSSAGATTPDGRTYPSMVALHYACGSNNTYTDSSGAYWMKYGRHTHTSSAAPAVAGSAALFKHWYLVKHGASIANQPGRLISNLLNMADGFATDQYPSGGTPM